MNLVITVDHSSGFRWDCKLNVDETTVLGVTFHGVESVDLHAVDFEDGTDLKAAFIETMVCDFLDADYQLVGVTVDGLPFSEEQLNEVFNRWEKLAT